MKHANIYAPFRGDGRRSIRAQDLLGYKCFIPAGTFPIPVKNATARMLIDALLVRRISNHSGMGGTLWVLTSWCEVNDINYKLTTHTDHGKVVGFTLSLPPINQEQTCPESTK